MLRENDKVMVDPKAIPGASTEIKYGRIHRIFPTFDDKDLLIVKLDSGNLIKCTSADVKVVTEDPKKPDEITISREDLLNAIVKVTNPIEYDVDPTTAIAISLTGILIGKRLERELFGEVEND